jgi:hypothetical protein
MVVLIETAFVYLFDPVKNSDKSGAGNKTSESCEIFLKLIYLLD